LMVRLGRKARQDLLALLVQPERMALTARLDRKVRLVRSAPLVLQAQTELTVR